MSLFCYSSSIYLLQILLLLLLPPHPWNLPRKGDGEQRVPRLSRDYNPYYNPLQCKHLHTLTHTIPTQVTIPYNTHTHTHTHTHIYVFSSLPHSFKNRENK